MSSFFRKHGRIKRIFQMTRIVHCSKQIKTCLKKTDFQEKQHLSDETQTHAGSLQLPLACINPFTNEFWVNRAVSNVEQSLSARHKTQPPRNFGGVGVNGNIWRRIISCLTVVKAKSSIAFCKAHFGCVNPCRRCPWSGTCQS